MRKILFIASLLFLQSICCGQAGSLYFKSRIDSILKKPLFDSTQIAFSVYDLTDGVPVFNKNEKLLLRPASALKLFTTAAALNFLKPDYTFKTNLYYIGTIKDSTLNGNIFIEGGFSPELNTADLNSLAAQIRKQGINRINGNLYADLSKGDSLFWGKGWMWDDDSDKDFPYMNSLPVNKNSIMIITSPTIPGEKASVKTVPETRFITINNKTLTIEKDSNSISVLRNWLNRKNEIAVSGIIGSASFPDTAQVNIVYPEKYLLSLFTELLKKNNIQFNGLADTLKTPSAANLISTAAHPLTGIIKNTNKESDNLNAEMILRVMAYEKYKRKVSAADGIKMLDSLIQITGIKKGNYRIVDGSGVSFYNLISAEMIIEILKFERSKPEQYKLFLNSLPIAGVDGTLKARLKDFAHLQNINAKTGSLSGTSTIAGYINTVHGHTMAFALLIQNFTGSPKRIRDLQDEICRAVFLIKSDKDE